MSHSYLEEMMQIRIQLAFQCILIFMAQCSSAILPQWVHRVESCPDSNKFSEWVEASKRLNCFHNLISTAASEQAKVYHCLPSSYLNETVEFCGKSVPIAPGHCPIYNYNQDQISYQPTYYNCSRFKSGCPKVMFHSKKVYIHPDCLKIDRVSNCYIADTDCPNIPTTPRSKTVTEIEPRRHTTTLSSKDFSENLDSVNVVKVSDHKVINESTVAIAGILSVLFVVTGSIVLFLFRKRKFICHKDFFLKTPRSIPAAVVNDLDIFFKTPRFITAADVNNLEEKQNTYTTGNDTRNGSPVFVSMENGQAGYDKSEEESRMPLLDNMSKGVFTGEYNYLLWSLAENMKSDVFNRMKRYVKDRGEIESNTLDDIDKPKDLLEYLDKTYFASNNIVYLQGLFLRCKAPHLYDLCSKYVESRGEPTFYFEARILEIDHTKVKYVVNCPGISVYPRSEVEKLRLMLATLIHANYDDILVSGLQNGCVIVTMMIRNCLIPKLKAIYTSEKISMTCQWMLKLSMKYQIIKVMIQDEILYPPDILSNFAELTAEEELSRQVLRSSFEAKPEIPKTNNLDRNILNALEHKERTATFEDVAIAPKNLHDFLERIGGSITDDTWNSMKIHLSDLVDPECVGKLLPTKMLNELSSMIQLQYNVSFLEWVFDKCGESKLVKECREFFTENQFQLECFNTNFTPCGEGQFFEIQFMVFELESYKNELQDLRYWLAKTIHVHPGQILMTALKTGPIVVTFLMREKHCKAILQYLQTDDGRIAASHKRIGKIVQNGNVIEIGKALNGSNFVQIRLRLRGNGSGIRDGLRNLALHFLRRTGITMDGNEIYTRTVPSDIKIDGAKCKPIKEESYIKKNRNLILDNLEPMTIEQTEIADLFDKDELASMKKLGGRRERAEYFLKLCENLEKERKEMACAHLESIVSLQKEKSHHEELSPVKKWIQQNRENLLDEIDADFIENTIYHMENVPEEVKTSWSDRNKSRKAKASIFLEFALQTDEYIKALKRTIEENGIKIPE